MSVLVPHYASLATTPRARDVGPRTSDGSVSISRLQLLRPSGMPKDKKRKPAAKSMAEAIAEEKRKRGMPTTTPAAASTSATCREQRPSKQAGIKKRSKLKRKAPGAAEDKKLHRRDESEEEGHSEDDSHGALAVIAAETPHLINIAPALVKYTERRLGQGAGCVMLRSNVAIEYTGRLAASRVVFDRSKEGAPLQFMVGTDAVVEGFEDGVLGMKLGGERTIHVPPEFGYGAEGFKACKIPPNAALEFDVRLVGLSQSITTSL